MSTIPDETWHTSDKIEQGRRMIAAAVKLYKPRKVWALCSGGNDSLCSTHLAMSTGLCDGVASINTTIGIQATRDHMAAVAERFGWPLRWLAPPVSFIELCERFGLPGPAGHSLIYQRLKERCVNQLVRESKQRIKDRVMLITGSRVSESVRRMGHAKAVTREKAKLWVAPIINWENEDKWTYLVDHGIQPNPVTPLIGISGECICGCFAKPGEREKIAHYFPEANREIVACEVAAMKNCQHAAWGERPAKKSKQLCQQCDRKWEDEAHS